MTTATHTTSLSLDSILKEKMIISRLQPLISIKKRAVFGFEALSRGSLDGVSEDVSPKELFDAAGNDAEKRLELDRLCRDKGLDAFKPLHEKRKDVLLTINVDPKVLDSGAIGSDYFLRQVLDRDINPNNIIIEILESDVTNNAALEHFVGTYRDYGFLIALDDIGAGHSNFERMARIRPEILKLDRFLVSGVDNEFYKQEVVRSLVGLGKKIGGLVTAEGVEREAEAVFLMELGVDVFQGFFFARPADLQGNIPDCSGPVARVAESFKKSMLTRITGEKHRHRSYEALRDQIVSELEVTPPAEFDHKLVEFIGRHNELECLYVLNPDGIQSTSTICNPYKITENKRFIYQPAAFGADHSLKEYYLPIKAGLTRFTTDPYISLASGNTCITMAVLFRAVTGKSLILCMDIGRD